VAARQLKSEGLHGQSEQFRYRHGDGGRDFQDLGKPERSSGPGDFIEGEANVVNANATLITIFGGANDVNV